jgi:hypothetical protein
MRIEATVPVLYRLKRTEQEIRDRKQEAGSRKQKTEREEGI